MYNMKNIIFYYLTIFCGLCINAELEYYPGFRRPSTIFNWEKSSNNWEKDRAAEYALEQLTEFLREHEQRLAEQEEGLERVRPLPQHLQRPGPEFTFFPGAENRARTFYYPKDSGDVFAVAPPDVRYYEPAPEDFYIPEYDTDSEISSERVQQVLPVQKLPKITKLHPVEQNQQEETLSKPKPKPETLQVVQQRSEEQVAHLQNIPLRQQIQQTAARLLQASPGAGGIAGQEAVFVKPVLQDDTAGVYIIAVVAGISAAATVGLIAFGIGWYKQQKSPRSQMVSFLEVTLLMHFIMYGIRHSTVGVQEY